MRVYIFFENNLQYVQISQPIMIYLKKIPFNNIFYIYIKKYYNYAKYITCSIT